MMRRLLVLVMAAALLGGSLAEGARGRLGRGAHSQQQRPVENPSPPPASFFENLTTQTLATDGYCSHGLSLIRPEVGGDAIYVAYQTNTNGCGTGVRMIKALQYSYVTGEWSVSSELTSGNPGCCDAHEVPAPFRDPSGFIWLFHGAIASAVSGSVATNGPYYYKSSSANSVSAWGSQTRSPKPGSISEMRGGSNSTYLFICGSNQWGYSDGGTSNPGADLHCLRKKHSDDTWTVGPLIADHGLFSPTQPNGSQGDPSGCVSDIHVDASGTYHVAWGGSLDACGGNSWGIWYAQSSDNGDNWSSINGSATFTWPSGLSPTGHTANKYTWDSDYEVITPATTRLHAKVRVLSDGKPIILKRMTNSLLRLFRWNGTSWATLDIETATCCTHGITMEVAADDRIFIWQSNGSNIEQYVVPSPWTTATKTRLHTLGSEVANRELSSVHSTSLGGKERVILQWAQNVTGGASTNIMVKDIPL